MKQWLYPAGVTGRGSVGLLVVRLVAGYAFVLHGWGKLQKPLGWMGDPRVPGAMQALAAAAEFGGGLAWILGLLTPLGALGIGGTMIGALTLVHFPRGDAFVPKFPAGGSFELPAVYLAVAVLLFFAGPGVLSFDALLFGRRIRSEGLPQA